MIKKISDATAFQGQIEFMMKYTKKRRMRIAPRSTSSLDSREPREFLHTVYSAPMNFSVTLCGEYNAMFEDDSAPAPKQSFIQ